MPEHHLIDLFTRDGSPFHGSADDRCAKFTGADIFQTSTKTANGSANTGYHENVRHENSLF